MTEPLLLSIPATAEVLGVGKDLVWELVHSGELPTVHIRRRRLVRLADLRQYVDQLRPEQLVEGADDHRGGLAVVPGGPGRGTGRRPSR